MTELVTVQMTVSGTEYYLSTEGYLGSNYYNPYVASLPTIKFAGEGWIKIKAGQLQLTNQPDKSDHPFGYSTNFNSLITNPDQQFLTAINVGEPSDKKLALWYGYAVIRSINSNILTFDLFEFANYTSLGNTRAVGDWPISSFTAGNPTVINISNTEMGGNNVEDYLKIGDQVKIPSGQGAQSPIVADTYYTVTALSGNAVSIDLDSTSASFTALQVVTASGTSGGSASKAYLNKSLNTPYAFLAKGAVKRQIPRDRYWQDGYSGKYAFIGYTNWYPAPGYGSGDYETNIYIDGVNSNSSFTVSAKVYQNSSNWDGTLLYEARTTEQNIYDLFYLYYGNSNFTKAPNSNNDVIAGIMYMTAKDTFAEEFMDEICKNTNYQFYIEYYQGTSVSIRAVVIDKANVPSATVLNESEILETNYKFKNIRSVDCNYKSFTEVGSLANDNYQFYETQKNLSVSNTSLTSGSEKKVTQMHDAIGQQNNYLNAILENTKKLTISCRIDNINSTIKPGDNLNFTKSEDNITCNQFLVREIDYDLNNQTTNFVGDGTITLLETT